MSDSCPCDLIRAIVFIAFMLITSQGSSAQPKVKQGTANVNGAAIFYETKGKGFPIVFVSGGGILDRRGWDEQCHTFAKHYRVVRYDIRGIGKSSRPEKSFSHSADLYAFLTFLKIKRAHLVGLSVGGAIAIDFAIEHPEMVDRLILAAPGLSSYAKAQENMQSLNALADLVKTNGIEHVIRLTLDAPFVLSKENVSGRKKVREIYLDNTDVFASGFPVFSLWQPIQPPPEERLASIRARVLIIRGDNDNPEYAALTDKISNGIPKSTTVIIPGGTHFLNLEKPAEFNDAMQVFLRHNSQKSYR